MTFITSIFFLIFCSIICFAVQILILSSIFSFSNWFFISSIVRTCNSETCWTCLHNTVGTSCQNCKSGYTGDATVGTPVDCVSCYVACNGHTSKCYSSLNASITGGILNGVSFVLFLFLFYQFSFSSYYDRSYYFE